MLARWGHSGQITAPEKLVVDAIGAPALRVEGVIFDRARNVPKEAPGVQEAIAFNSRPHRALQHPFPQIAALAYRSASDAVKAGARELAASARARAKSSCAVARRSVPLRWLIR